MLITQDGVKYGFVANFLSNPPDSRNELSRYMAGQFLQYIRDIEARRKPGDDFILSSFQGIPFDEDKTFDEREARQVLRSLMPELRKRLAQSKVVDFSAVPPRVRLTGAWDVVSFALAKSGQFTDHPHLSIGMNVEGASIALILPNGAKAEYWRHLREAGSEGLSECLLGTARSFEPLRRKVHYEPEPRIMFQIVQRHFHARSHQVLDGQIRFDLDSLGEAGTSQVKPHPGWISSAWAILGQTRRVNLQVALIALYPFSKSSVSYTSGFIEELVRAAEAMRPFIDLLTGER